MAKREYPVATMPADATRVYIKGEKQKAPERKEERKEVDERWKRIIGSIKPGKEVEITAVLPMPYPKYGMGGILKGIDYFERTDRFKGKVVEVGEDYIAIEAPLWGEWRNLWQAKLRITEADALGLATEINKSLAEFGEGWVSRVEIRDSWKGPLLRYTLLKSDVLHLEELKVDGKNILEEPKPIKPIEKKPPEKKEGEAEKKEEPKKGEKVVPKKQPSGPSTVGGRAVSREQIEELEEKTNEELLNSITLNYPVPGKYKGYSYMGGVNGLQRGVDVAALQILLNRILGTDLTVNGVYDERTAAAVKALQNRVGVRQDGLFGIDTKTGLREYLKKKEGETKPVPGEEEKAPKAPGEEVAPPPKKEEVPVDITVYTPIHVDHNIRMDKMNENEIKEDGEGVKELMQEKDISKGKKAGRPGVPELYFIHSDIRAEGTKKNPRRFEDIMKNYLFVRTPEGELLSFDAFQKEYKLGKRTMGVFSWTKTSNEIFRYVAKNRLSIVFKLSEDPNLLPEDLKPYAGGWAEGIVEVANPESNYLRVKIVRVRKGFEEETREETSAPIGTISEESAEAPPLGEGMGGEETKAEEGEKV